MKNAVDFITFALLRTKRSSVPAGAVLTVPRETVGAAGEWEYLWGAHGQIVTQDMLDDAFATHYNKKGWTREEFDKATAGWVSEGKHVTDCEGLLDAYLGNNVTADYCYNNWCTEKGQISAITRPWVLGEAVFRLSSARMVHVGWICGFIGNEPLVVEAKGIHYGVVVTKLSWSRWTHRGLVTKQLNYEEEKPVEHPSFKVESPMKQGDIYYDLQKVLKDAGYLPTTPNGIWGKNSYNALKSLCEDTFGKVEEPKRTKTVEVYVDGVLKNKFIVEDDENE